MADPPAVIGDRADGGTPGPSWALRLGGRSRGVVTARMWRAMSAGQLVLHCQPTVTCADGRICAAEALVRWRHRSGALIFPGEWVPSVERSMLRRRFNLEVLALAAAHQEAWSEEGLRVPLSVNITPAVLADRRFVAAVEEMFAKRPPADLRLEITERTTTINSRGLKANVERLSRLGFQFLLDDFGVGYSSLQRLANLPVSTLKIDRSLSCGVRHDPSHRAIVRWVLHLARALAIDVVCEGVEDGATWNALRGLGCDRIQGYHVARPMPADSFPAFVRAYRPAQPCDGTAGEPRSEHRWRSDRRSGRDRRTTGRA